MKKTFLLGIAVVSMMFSSGCVVWSLYPWLDDDGATDQPSLAGRWDSVALADNELLSVIFTADDQPGKYSISYVATSTNGLSSTSNSYSGSFHSLDRHHLLVVGPGPDFDPSGREGQVGAQFAVIPVYLLFNVELTNNTMNLYCVRPDDFDKRSRKCRLPMVPREPNDQDAIPTAAALSKDMERFVRKNLKDPMFFSDEPLYSLVRRTETSMPASPSNAVPTP